MSDPSLLSQDPSLHSTAGPTSTGARSTRPQQPGWQGPNSRQTPRRGLTPISTGSAGHTRPGSSGGSPSRAAFSPTSFAFNHASISANRQGPSRQSSTSSNNSYASPSASGHHATSSFHSGARSRATTSTGSPRLASPLASFSAVQGGGTVASGSTAPSRFARQSPSLPGSAFGSPVSSTGGGSSGQLTSLLVTQLNILLSTIKENNFEPQAEKIRRLVDDNGMELFPTYFRRLLQSNASTIFPGSARSSATADNASTYQMLVQEMQKILTDPQQAEKIAQSLDTSEGELFRDFDLSTFIEHFRLDQISKVAIALACRTVSKPDLRARADEILTNNFQAFLSTVASPVPSQHNGQLRDDLSPLVLANIIERVTQDPPPNWSDGQWENFNYSIHMRYRNLNMQMPPVVQSAFYLTDLINSENGRLARFVERRGPRGTASLEACKEMLAGVETRDISYLQIANALLLMVSVQNGDAYNPAVFIDGLRQHRAGPRIDWTDVVQGFDREKFRITKKQFLGLYNALLPLAREYTNFDIQSLWGGKWDWPETQLSFVVAFLSTTPEELDVRQIPDLRQAFTLDDYRDAPESVKAYAATAVKHPLVSTDAIKALFGMIFQSQETYNVAQMLGIPDTLINPNMTIFVCAAASIDHPEEPWSALQDQALKQLFYPFLLKQHENYDFVMHSLWMHDKAWVAGRMVEFYQQDNNLLMLIYDHAEEHGWLELLLTISSNFTLDLATYAHGKGRCHLPEWSQPHINTMGPKEYGAALMVFLRAKVEDESNVQREHVLPTTLPLALKTVHTLLLMITDLLPDEKESGPLYRLCLQTYPRLFNYGEDEKRDAIIDANCERGNALPDEAGGQMEERYKKMYGGHATPDQVVTELKDLKESEEPADQDLFAAMLHGLFDEYNCFGEYPNEALATTAVLFGGLIQFNVLSGIAEQAAIFMIFEAVSEYGHDDSMYRFGLQAMIHIIGRLKEWPQVAQRILVTPTLLNTQPYNAAQIAIKELELENADLNVDAVNGLTNGALDESFRVDSPTPAFSAIHVDPPIRSDIYEEPNEDVSDKVMFVLNNVSKRNLEEKFKDLEVTLEDKHHQWFAHYLVEELAKSQPNFQGLYLQLLESFNRKILWAEVLRETYVGCARMLNAQSTMESTSERTNLKNLAAWLGSLTLARNQPILHRNISFRELLIEGHDTQRNIVAIPFTCKVLIHAANSKVFKPPNPWITELLGLLSELYHCFDLKINLKFEIEVLCRDLNMDIKNIAPLDILRSRPLLAENNMLQQYVPDGGPDGFADMHLMGLSKRAPNERFSPEAVIQALPDLGGMLQIPQAAGNVTQPQLRGIFVNAAQQAIYEIIAPVVERSVTIAAISTAELVQKDFATEADDEKLLGSSHTVVRALSGSLALVTCKEPLRMSIMNNIRILAARSLPEQLPEGQIIMFVNDNIDTVCSLVERAAEDHSIAEIDAQLAPALLERRQHNEQRPNEPFNNPPVSRWAQLIPEPFRQDPQGVNASGLNRQQLGLYEDFGRQARITPTTHANNASVDTSRQLPDVLSDSFLANLPTPAEAPAIPRPTPNQQRMPGMQPPQGQHQVNGYVDGPNIGQRTLELMQDLQQASREAPEEHIADIGGDAPIRRIFEQLVDLIGSAVQKDNLAVAAGQQCFMAIYSEAQKRLEIEVFVRLLVHLCKMSIAAGRHLTMYLASTEDDKLFNVRAALALLAEGMLEIQHIDVQASRALKARRPAVLPFLRDLLDEALLSDSSMALRSDFVLTYEALVQWLTDDPTNEAAREIITRLHMHASQQNGMPSPEEQDKQDQLEYIFEEWVRLQRKETPEHSYLAFVRQLHDQNIVTDPHDTMTFFRACLEMSCAAFERVASAPYATQDAAYVQIDALARLIAFLVLYQSPIDGEPQANKAKSLDAFMRLVILVMSDHHIKQRERWNARVYFRLFSSLMCELHAGKLQLGVQQEQEIYRTLAKGLQVLQPRHFPGFTYPWLALLSHRLLVPAFLSGQGRTNGGWEIYTKLLSTLFLNLGELLASSDASVVVQDFYRGVLRFLLMLHHDFPEFLIENHLQLNSSIPTGCAQLHNIVNSPVARAAVNDQPDPFTPGLKVNRLDQVRQAPTMQGDYTQVLDDAGIKEAVEHICAGPDVSNEDYDTIASTIGGLEGPSAALVCNALVVYIGVHATSASSVFSSAAAPARLLERLLRERRPATRYQLITAMMNKVRYVNTHTHYFVTALQHMFGIAAEDVQEQILRVLVERLMVPRPHPWGTLVLILELVKNQSYDVWNMPFMKTAPQVQQLLMGLAASQDRIPRSPLGAAV